jgi:hypothetical protein
MALIPGGLAFALVAAAHFLAVVAVHNAGFESGPAEPLDLGWPSDVEKTGGNRQADLVKVSAGFSNPLLG